MKLYYSKRYFKWHQQIGEFGGKANLFKFDKYVDIGDRVVDYGCGGGYLLRNIKCKDKIGIEVNEEAIKEANKNEITVYKTPRNISDNWADVIISNHALEHVQDPYQQLKILYQKLKKNGRIIFVVPCESYKVVYKKNDINQHIYSWSPGALGNLFTQAGFKVESSNPLYHKWPPFYLIIYNFLGEKVFNLLCRIWGLIDRRLVQIQIVAKK